MRPLPWAVIPFTPPPIFTVGPLQFSAHGLAFLCAAVFVLHLTKKRLPKELHNAIEDAVPLMLLGAVMGARGLFFIQEPNLWSRPWEFFTFWQGGLVSYGGMIGAIAGLAAYAGRKNIPLAALCEALAPPAMIGWGIGRIGCFLSWYDEYGKPSSLPWAFSVYGESRHPVMLYLSLTLIIAGLYLMRLPQERPFYVTGLTLISYGVIRAVLDQWRDYDPASLVWYSRAACLAIALWGLKLYLASLKNNPARQSKNPLLDVEREDSQVELSGEQSVG